MDYETLKSGFILFIKVLVALAMLRFNYFLIQPELSNFFEDVWDFIHSHKYNYSDGRKTNKIEITPFQKRKPKRLLSIVRTAVLSVYVVFVFDTFILCMTSRSILAAIQI